MNKLIKQTEKRYKVALDYKTDAQWFASLKRDGVPSLAKLLKMIRKQIL